MYYVIWGFILSFTILQRLLMELEEFAFQGCPDVRGPQEKQSPQKTVNNDGDEKNVSSENVYYIHVHVATTKYKL